MQRENYFSRWGIIMAALGMAIGTGNIWRFPRILANNGGGAFLIPWAIFLFLWSIPLLITEFAIGQYTRKGVGGAFGKLLGNSYNWMGGFIGICTTAIMFYYSVVTGWCLKYFLASLNGSLTETLQQGGTVFWNSFINSSYEPIFFHLLAILIGSLIIYRGVVTGIERANKIMIPTLVILLIFTAIRALTLPGALNGINYLFNPDWQRLSDYKIWLEGLSQSAWSTGAGWGLLLTYATYTRRREDIVLNSFITGFGNNSASLLASLAIFPAVFALAPLLGVDPAAKLIESGPASTGLTFIWMPQLFQKMPMGSVFMPLFFLTLSFAAFSSLISMFVLATRMLNDWGFSQKRAIIWVAVIGFLLGIPSAANLTIFENQDWVWGLGLLVNGLFLTILVCKYGATLFRLTIINSAENDFSTGRWYDFLMKYILPIEFFALMSWWFYQAIGWQTEWWNPFKGLSIGTCLFQWGIIILLLIIFNRTLSKKLSQNTGSQS
ncbi:sodium-dependent transporter [candidate division KSB1 bacterium]|nr:sodium-dependent transporter [candidate division KSB1 bacterium]